MALAMQRYPGRQQLFVGAMKELKHLQVTLSKSPSPAPFLVLPPFPSRFPTQGQ